ncbi:hypothetical protein BD769DRAFT_1653705 [Suillus cothurnatus]|nr:hypothetical protein BD769DRAFT_1653705 [Suillus cothurnatus]
MGPPRRARSNSSVSTHSQQHRNRQPQLQEPTPPETASAQSHLGMSPQSRYLSNMKVVRRRDPSIVSIFDQFSHVCVYHHNGDKWEKQGYEGSMFLYERDSYPPYGLYILNRVGMDDYIQRLYPEDGIGAHGSYLMMRSQKHEPIYPLSKQEGPASKFAPEFVVPNLEQLQDAEKGRSQTVGLWCFATDARESMQDVVLRLHSYIKKNLPYPEEYRYGPDRPPPPNFRSSSRASERSHMRSASSASNTSIHSISESEEYHAGSQPALSESSYSNGNVSELDKLFAKLGGTGCTPQQTPQSQTKESTTASLLAGLSGSGNAHRTASVPPPTSNSVPPTRGLALLDTIFASAPPPPPPPSSQLSRGPSRSGAASASLPPPTSIHSQTTYTTQAQSTTFGHTAGHTAGSQSPLILSPKPTSTALPQVLNQDVISTLLGFPASRAYEGDNEASDDGSISEGGYSVSSTVLDADAENNTELQAAGSSSGLPLLAVPMSQSEYNSTRNGSGKTLGDVTPRPPLRGFNSDITVVGDLLAAAQTHKHLHPDTTPTLTNVNGSHSVPKPRSLIPFEADSDLWPYPRAPLLDFADTSALSDPDAFAREQRSKNKRSQKKGRKEREKDREREREEIEKSWDVPPPVAVVPLSQPQGAVSTPAVPVNGKAKHSSADGPNVIDAHAVHASLLSALAQKKSASSNNLSKNDFVREVLTLIHTDKDFVDTLWQEYTSSAK